MRRLALVCVIVALSAGVSVAFQGSGKKPKHTIKEIMKKAHKDGLLKKVTGGDASAEEKHALLDLYCSLAENEAPKGDQKEWIARCDAVVVAAARVDVGREDGIEALKKATACKGCHGPHKP